MSSSNKRQRIGGVTVTMSTIPSSAAASNFNTDSDSMLRKPSRQQVKHLGKTPAVPCAQDLQKSDDLRKALEPFIVFETKKELNHGSETVIKLSTPAQQFDDIEIHLLFARLSLKEIPDPFDLNDERQSSTSNVPASTKKRISMKFNRGMPTVDEIIMGRASWDKLYESPSFFNSYRHFVVLSVNSQTANNHLEFCRLVKSKIRFLIGNLQRNQHISSARVNPKCFDHKKSNNNKKTLGLRISSDNEEDDSQTAAIAGQHYSSPFCSLWFIGLELERRKNLNLDLTEDIQNFVDLVIQHGIKIKVFKVGMSIEANYIKRKQLSQYLDAGFLKRERNSMSIHNNFNAAAQRKRISTEMLQKDTSNGSSATKAKRLRPSESVIMGYK